MKIYTKTGDQGTTSLFGGTRVAKHHIRIESYGTLDELNSYLGLIRDQDINQTHKDILLNIQENLFIISAILATPPESQILKNGQSRLRITNIQPADIELLENQIDKMQAILPVMTHFIIPGGHVIVSYCHITRSVCRRAERLVIQLHELSPIDLLILQYLNRLSDYLFVLARKLSQELQAVETLWIPKNKALTTVINL